MRRFSLQAAAFCVLLGLLLSGCAPGGVVSSKIWNNTGSVSMQLAHRVLVILYHLLRERQPYADLGADYFDKRDTTRLQRQYVRRLEQLGYAVTLTPAPAA
jgi:hypothetical protein